MITVNANDLNIENLPVKLHIKIETVGITIENPPTINTTPIFINGGETNVLFGEDLEDYFNINNLIFKGYSKNTYKRTGQLPEGFYKFSIDILHYNTNRPISNIGTVTAWIALGKPPVLKLPLNNAKMGQYKGVPLSFSWLPAAVGSPVSANSIQYKFEMWEMHIPAINPNTIAATTPLFHEHTDFNTIYTLYPSTLLMTPGMKYAWRITASDISGFVPFEQNGHSEIRTFIYKAACDSVTNLTAKNRGKSALFKWESKSNHTSFNIEMQNPQTGWVNNSESFQSKAEFFDLNYGDKYKMRVQAVCDGDPDSKSDFSDWKTVTIPKPAPATDDCPECVCDDKIPDAEITNFDLRDDLQPGDTIINKTGTSRYIVKSVEPQGDGAYKGVFLFWTEIWNLKFICNYWDLQVNTDNVIVNMDFESVYDPKFLVDIDAATGYLDSLSNNISTLITDLTPKDTLNTDDSIISIYVNDGDSLIVVTVDDDGNTNEIVLSGDADDAGGTLITDDDGNEYIINNDGKPMGTGEYLNTGGGNQDKIDNYNKDKEENHLSESVTINFTQADKQKYGFDSYNNQKSALQTKYPTLKNGYRAAFKSIASFGSDIVGVSSKHSNVVYKDEMGIPCTKTGENLNIRGSTNGSDVTLYAYHTVNDTTEKVAGKLNILSFDEQAKQLYIVPVNGANVPDAKALKDVINSTYKQAITRWEVTKIDNLSDVTFKSGNMSHGGTSAISVYNKDQRTIVKRFKEVHGKLEKDAYYLFFVEGVQFKGRSIAGYMPLQRQVGFIYDNPNLNIIAHELGHGAFNLRHTFSSDNFIASEMSTQNLMDYKGGVELWKHQWKLIQSPDKLLFAWAQDEKEGEYSDPHLLQKLFQQIRCSYLNGLTIFSEFNRYGYFKDPNSKYGDIYVQIKNKNINLGKVKIKRETVSGGKAPNHKYILDYGGLIIEQNSIYEYIPERKKQIDDLQDYLFPEGENILQQDLAAVMKKINGKSELNSDDIEAIRNIANCSAKLISTENRYLIIKYIFQYSRREAYEDLVLDLMENYSDDDKVFANEFLGYLANDKYLMKGLFHGMDNSNLFSKEDNADRFIQIIYALWTNSNLKDKSREEYKYVKHGDYIGGDVPLSPYSFVYDGSFLFSDCDYEDPIIRNGKIIFNYTFRADGKTHYRRKEYLPFQPIRASIEKEGIYSTDKDIPAILLASIIEKDNYEHTIKTISLTADIALTFTAIGNITKLRHLSTLQKGVRILIGSVEIASSGLDIVLNYTDICPETEEFCKTLREYNQCLQLGLLSGEIVSEIYIKRLKAVRKKAKLKYGQDREKLISQNKFSSDEIKKLDEQFEFNKLDNSLVNQFVKYDPSNKILNVNINNLDDIVDNIPGTITDYDILPIESIVINGNKYELSTNIKLFKKNGKVKCYIEDGYCFTKGTPILMNTGEYKPIEKINIGDTVTTYNHKSNKRSFGIVKRLFKRTTTKITKLAIAGSLLCSTPGHEIYADGNYQSADKLTTNSILLNSNLDTQPISNTTTVDSTTIVYNFEVSKFHNYFAGEASVLVHNTCGWLSIRKSVDRDLFKKFHNSIINARLTTKQRKILYDKIAELGNNKTKFLSDFADDATLLREFGNSPELINIWSKVIEQPDWIRKNTKLLENLSSETDEIIDKIKAFYSSTHKNRSPKNFTGKGTYNKGVKYDEFGFPELREHNPLGDDYIFTKAKGNHSTDFSDAREWLTNNKTKLGYDNVWFKPNSTTFKVKKNGKWSELLTWHHHQNGTEMIPVPTSLHTGLPHVGGVETVKQGINHIFIY
jgi:hypothetical protein